MHRLSNFIDRHLHAPDAPGGPGSSCGDHAVAGAGGAVQHSDTGVFPGAQDLFRYRKQRGVNLGSWFVLERWIADAPFRFAAPPAGSDLDVARGSYPRQVLERHWDTWISDADWAYIAQRGINTVRIPIGYYHLCAVDPGVLEGTDFAGLGHVFEGAWPRIADAVATASRYGLGVLIDLHAAPGKQNNDAHAGTSGPATFFTSPQHMQHTLRILRTLLSALRTHAHSFSPPLANLVGIELLNEPAPNGAHAALERWYAEAIVALRAVDSTIPLVLGDCWWTDHYADFVARNGAPALVLDHHLYRCFTPDDARTSAAQHARNLSGAGAGTPAQLARVAGQLADAGCALVVGEWSGALNPGSLHGVDERAAKREFVGAQLALFERVCAGWFFWTYRKEQAGDTGWGWRDAVEAGVFPAWVGLRARMAVPGHDAARDGRRNGVRDKALGEHTAWWSKHPGHYEHWRFDEGFVIGWDDACRFFAGTTAGSAVPEIGLKGAWVKVRTQEHVGDKGASNTWEFEHGIKQGMDAARADVAQTYC